MLMETKEWFDEWFDSPYYHILYKHRNDDEARFFIDNLVKHLAITLESHIMDLACGKGRHSIYLNQRGHKVTGLDLSSRNITLARKFENASLRFFEHDMRDLYKENEFDFILNLFTSFGYFENGEENQKAIDAASLALKKGGKMVIDFLNPYKIIKDLIPYEEKLIDGILFKIRKTLNENNFIIKEICFSDKEQDYCYYEKVKAISQNEFLDYFNRAGLQIVNIFGNYHLDAYNQESSERMIFILKR